MRRVYLAARYSRHVELQGYARELEKLGFEVTSRWIRGNHQLSAAELAEDGGVVEKRARFAREDWEDLLAADLCISFTEEQYATNSRGGRHVEFGAALALGKVCAIVGPHENVFHCLPQVRRFETWDACLDALVVGWAWRGEAS